MRVGRPEEWALPIVIRTRRASPFPASRVDSAAAARKLIEEKEARLVADVKTAEEAKRAKQNAKSFGDIVDAYRRCQLAEGSDTTARARGSTTSRRW